MTNTKKSITLTEENMHQLTTGDRITRIKDSAIFTVNAKYFDKYCNVINPDGKEVYFEFIEGAYTAELNTARGLSQEIRYKLYYYNDDNGHALNFFNDAYLMDLHYLSDAFNDYADNSVSIYYSDILDFIKDNPDAVQSAVDNYYYECNNATFNIYKLGQAAEYMQTLENLEKQRDEIITALIYDYLSKKDINDVITEEQKTEIENIVNNSNDNMYSVVDAVNELFNIE